MLGLGVVLQSSAMLFLFLKLAGAAYLLYIGLRHLLGRSNIAPPPPGDAAQVPRGAGRLYLEAALVATMNPSPSCSSRRCFRSSWTRPRRCCRSSSS